jgi:Flp pilus assembly pilin Flp
MVGSRFESDEGRTGARLRKEMHMMFLKPYLWLAARREGGQTMAEYAVVLGVITLAVVGVFTALAGGISGAIDSVKGAI